MSAHLGSGVDEVYAAADAVNAFWFEEVPAAKRFAKDEQLDRTIAERFGAWRDDVLASEALGWRGEPETLLAAIVLLDQFSRNIHRDSPQAYAADPLAESLAHEAIGRGWDGELPPERAVFLLMPLMHSEHADAQRLSVRKFEALGLEENARYAREHAEVIARFGRFPTRNAVLGRETTPQEAEWLSRSPVDW